MKLDLHSCSARHPAAVAAASDALTRISLALASGEQLAIIGPSGAGKTTLLQLLACAQRPEQGNFEMDGVDPWQLGSSALKRQRAQVFLAPQVPPLPPRQRVVSAVLAGRLPEMSLWYSLQSLFYPRETDLADAALAQFDLSEKLFERVDRLSGGERQRVGLARMLASSASLLLVDEPLSALDPERARQALQAICDAARERGATLVTSLHHVEMALAYFPRIVGLRGGELVFDLPSAEVSPSILQSLYASNLEELTGPAPRMDDVPAPRARVAMQCR
ncbi:Iron(3+)-hydroxamate import ATP-binding protein FhuC [Polaromonas vacuolata]|uniref:Iron(3+)-hydroxamate import ATP-binding protein FhuC n=1 Tax=Polaromonas vacuolata TaxID=37448 RepID=A0A6H2HAG3_9BURK|nr:ATP-binding cassette domain-containing protein [Polaromonas vacuolata]QJC56859.1 Iron(3+)-hydroxamate import ATP-binding protein FhuC [Polaromonas vacuolata]